MCLLMEWATSRPNTLASTQSNRAFLAGKRNSTQWGMLSILTETNAVLQCLKGEKAHPVVRSRKALWGRYCLWAGPFTGSMPRGQEELGQGGGSWHGHARPACRLHIFVHLVNKSLTVKKSQVCSDNKPSRGPRLELKAQMGDKDGAAERPHAASRASPPFPTQGVPKDIWADKWSEESCALERWLW